MSEYNSPDNLALLHAAVRSVPDFPKHGVIFRDLTPILQDPELFRLLDLEHLNAVVDLYSKVDVVVGMESRGFWFGPSLAHALRAGFVPARKPGKLPGAVVEAEYGLEYGSSQIQIHMDAIKEGHGVLIVDDLLATGGTAEAVGGLVRGLGGNIIAYLFAIELDDLKGRERLEGRVETLMHFPGSDDD
jgi:adenine phosphoribosyltransferase